MQIEAKDIEPGMVVDIYGGTERLPVTGKVAKLGAVQITDGIRTRGLDEHEPVNVAGYFNP